MPIYFSADYTNYKVHQPLTIYKIMNTTLLPSTKKKKKEKIITFKNRTLEEIREAYENLQVRYSKVNPPYFKRSTAHYFSGEFIISKVGSAVKHKVKPIRTKAVQSFPRMMDGSSVYAK